MSDRANDESKETKEDLRLGDGYWLLCSLKLLSISSILKHAMNVPLIKSVVLEENCIGAGS